MRCSKGAGNDFQRSQDKVVCFQVHGRVAAGLTRYFWGNGGALNALACSLCFAFVGLQDDDF
eukprot:scaffold159443_cov21-Tisochrysis_lutea.AAC.1